MGKLRKKPAKLVEQAEQASPVEPNKTNKTNKTSKKSKPSDAPITASELRELMTAEVGCLKLVSQYLSDIKALLEDIRDNRWRMPPLNDGWDRNTPPPPQPRIKYYGDPPGRQPWPTDIYGNPVPYAVYCGGGEGPQCQRR